MGGSWGGMFGTAFLINPQNQTHISGWIELSGMHNSKRDMALSIEWVIGKAEEQIILGKNICDWQKEIIWYNNNPNLFYYDNIGRHTENVDKLNGYAHDPSNHLISELIISTFLFFSPYSVSYFLNETSLQKHMWSRLENINLVPEMHKITIPSLILWGRHDGMLPVAIAQDFENLGSSNKYLYIFENSAHFIFNEEPELFVERVRTFVNKYK